MKEKIEALAAYILLQKERLDYYTNENAFEFTARNIKLFEAYRSSLSYQNWVDAAEIVIRQMPERIRDRGVAKVLGNEVKIEMERQTSEPFLFTIIHEMEFNHHTLIIQPVAGSEEERVRIKIHGAAWESMKQIFGTELDPVAKQTQVFKKD